MFFTQTERLDRRALWLHKVGERYRPISWTEGADYVRACAAALLAIGVQAGDRIAIFSENRHEWAIADLAALTCGALTVPIYATDTSTELRFILQDAGASVLFLSAETQLQKWHAIREHAGSVRRVIAFDDLHDPSIVTFREWLDRGRQALTRQASAWTDRRAALTASDSATIIYTSGTTGVRKGVVLSHGNFLSNCAAVAAVVPIRERDIHLSILPLSHVFERMAGHYLMIHQGATVAYAENMERVPQNIQEVRPTIMCAVPRLYEKIYAKVLEARQQGSRLRRLVARWTIVVGQRCAATVVERRRLPWPMRLQGAVARRLLGSRLRRQLGGRLRFFVSGSAPLSIEIAAFFDIMGVAILEGYGLTETSPVITVNTLVARRLGTVGRPVPGVEVRIAADGEIETRGPHVMQGYFNNASATQEVMRNGWLATGDIGHLDADGFLTITDRKKDLIITAGGKNVAPQKLENLLKADPLVNQVFVYGDRRPYLVALIVPNMPRLIELAHQHGIHDASSALVQHPDVQRLVTERVQQLCQQLPSYEQVKSCALLAQEFTMDAGEVTPTMKIRRKVVCERYLDLLESLYAAPQRHR